MRLFLPVQMDICRKCKKEDIKSNMVWRHGRLLCCDCYAIIEAKKNDKA